MLAVPQFAPVASSMVEHMLPETARKSDFESLLRKVQVARQKVFKQIRSAEPRSSLETLLQIPIKDALQEKERIKRSNQERDKKEYSITRSTLTDWRERNLLLRSWDFENIAGLRIAAICDERVQGFFPSIIDPNEPRWWCFSIAPPTRVGNRWVQSPVLPCPADPIPPGLKPGTLLFSPWPVFSPEWRSAGEFGAMRFYRLSVVELEAWQPDILSQFSPTKKISEDLFQILAESLLFSKIREILLPLAFSASSPNLFNSFDPEAYTFHLPTLLESICC